MSATIEINGDVAVITMNDGKANAINPLMLASLNAALDQAEKQARAVVIVGREQRFSAGFDFLLGLVLFSRFFPYSPDLCRLILNAS